MYYLYFCFPSQGQHWDGNRNKKGWFSGVPASEGLKLLGSLQEVR